MKMGVVMCCRLRWAKKHWECSEGGREEMQAALSWVGDPVIGGEGCEV